MKLLSKKAKERLLRLQREQQRRVARTRLERLRKRRERKKKQQPRRGIRIHAPTVFNIETDPDRGAVLGFLARLRIVFARAPAGSTLVIDFSRTRRFIAHGTLLFYAELTRLVEYGAGRIRVRCTLADNSRANQVLKQIGVFALCGQNAEIKTTREDVVHWRVARGHIVDNFLCAPAIEAYEGQMAEPLIDGIFRGLGEAMTNAKHHAYIAMRQDDLEYAPSKEDWWMFSQARDGYLSVVFCDLGVGIPATLPAKKPTLFARLRRLGRAESDAACIEEAIKDSRTRMRIQGRGYGLGNIVNAASSVRNGTVLVMSNRGCFVLNDQGITTSNFRHSIFGTLIYWRVPLGEGHAA